MARSRWYVEYLLERAQVRAARSYGNRAYHEKEYKSWAEEARTAPHADQMGFCQSQEHHHFTHFATFHWDMVGDVANLDALSMELASIPQEPLPDLDLDGFEF
jgi:hypothetical protein